MVLKQLERHEQYAPEFSFSIPYGSNGVEAKYISADR